MQRDDPLRQYTNTAQPGGGVLTLKGGTPMSGGQDPLFTPLPPFLRPPVTASFSSLDPYFDQNLQIVAPTREISRNFKENSALQPKFGSNFSSQAQNMLKNFSSLDHTFAKNQFFSPLFRRSAPSIPTQKKVECPPPGDESFLLVSGHKFSI